MKDDKRADSNCWLCGSDVKRICDCHNGIKSAPDCKCPAANLDVRSLSAPIPVSDRFIQENIKDAESVGFPPGWVDERLAEMLDLTEGEHEIDGKTFEVITP